MFESQFAGAVTAPLRTPDLKQEYLFSKRPAKVERAFRVCKRLYKFFSAIFHKALIMSGYMAQQKNVNVLAWLFLVLIIKELCKLPSYIKWGRGLDGSSR